MKLTFKAALASASMLCTVWPAHSAWAQAGQQAAQETQLEEILVTGRKREEVLTTVPVAITAVTAETLENSGVTSLQGMGTMVPSFTLTPAQDPGTNVISIRGITQVRFGEPPVALVVDGVQASSPDEGTQDLYDIERIEILKGPQGSTYGRNAMAARSISSPERPATVLRISCRPRSPKACLIAFSAGPRARSSTTSCSTVFRFPIKAVTAVFKTSRAMKRPMPMTASTCAPS